MTGTQIKTDYRELPSIPLSSKRNTKYQIHQPNDDEIQTYKTILSDPNIAKYTNIKIEEMHKVEKIVTHILRLSINKASQAKAAL